MLDDRLINAAADGRLSEVKTLIKTDININLTNQHGSTALMWAAKKGHEGIVARLLEAGAKVDLANKHGFTALSWAADNGHEGIVAQLLEAGAKVDLAANKYGYTALIFAAQNGQKGVVARLLEAGAKVDLASKYGFTALSWAADNGHEGIVAQLLEAGAKVDLADKDGYTALTWAARHGHEGIVAQLLKAGANPRHAKNTHDTAMSLAVQNKHASVVITLIKAGGFEPSQFKDNPDLLTFIQPLLLTMTKRKLDKLFKLTSTPDQVERLVKTVNNLTEPLKKEIRSHLIALIKEDAKKLAEKMLPDDLQACLTSLEHIRDNLHIIQPSPKEKEAKKEIQLLISRVESLVAEHKPLVAGSVASKIQLCLSDASKSHGFKLVQFKKDLKMELSALAKPNAAEIEELRKTVVKLAPDERKHLRETLKELFDEAIKKSTPDQWIFDLKNNHNNSNSAGKDIPFIAILRVSESGKKPDHNTKTWDHVIKKMKLIMQMYDAEASSNSKVSRLGWFGPDEQDEMGQVSDQRLNRHKIGNKDL